MIEERLLDGVDAAFAPHVSPNIPAVLTVARINVLRQVPGAMAVGVAVATASLDRHA